MFQTTEKLLKELNELEEYFKLHQNKRIDSEFISQTLSKSYDSLNFYDRNLLSSPKSPLRKRLIDSPPTIDSELELKLELDSEQGSEHGNENDHDNTSSLHPSIDGKILGDYTEWSFIQSKSNSQHHNHDINEILDGYYGLRPVLKGDDNSQHFTSNSVVCTHLLEVIVRPDIPAKFIMSGVLKATGAERLK